MSTDNLVDKNVIEELKEMSIQSGTGLLGKLIQIFKEDTQEKLNDLDKAIESNDLKSVEMTAHSLKSGSAYLGVNQLSDIAKYLEHNARSGAIAPDSKEKLEQASDIYKKALAELLTYAA